MWTNGRIPGGFGFPLGCAGVTAAAIAADVAGGSGHPVYSLVALGLVVAATATVTTVVAAAGTAAVAWAVHTGFLLGRAGQLVFDTASAQAALVFTIALVLGLLIARTQRPMIVPAPRRAPERSARRAASAATMRGRPAGWSGSMPISSRTRLSR